MVGRPKKYNREQLVESSKVLFWTHGYAGTSLTMLISSLRVSKSTFYEAFKSKDDLFQICLEDYGRSFVRQMIKHLNSNLPVFDSLESYFSSIAQSSDNSSEPKGCFLVSAANEIGNNHPKISPLIRHLMDITRQTLKNALDLAVRKREFEKTLDTERAAGLLLSQLCGLYTLVKADVQKDLLDQIVEDYFSKGSFYR